MSKLRSNKGMPNNSNKSKKSKKPIPDKPNNEAVEYFDTTLKIESNNTKANYNKGLSLIKLGKNEEAIIYFDKALFLDSDNIDANYNKGVALGKLNKVEEAIVCFNKILALYPNNSSALFGKGTNLGRLNKFEETIECFNKILDLDPHNINIYLGKGLALNKLNKYKEALECFDKVLILDLENVEANYNKGFILGWFGKLEEAIIYFDKALKIEPDNIDVNFIKGANLGNLGKHEEALVCFKKFLALDPNNIHAELNINMALYKLGKHEECHQWIQECIAKNIINYRMFSALYLFYRDDEKNNNYKQDIEEYIQKTIAIEYDKNSEGTEFYQYSPLSKEIIYNITNQEIYFSNPSNFNDPFDPLIRILNTDDSEDMLKLLNFRISCLSTNNSNILMWSHYANKHQGICIKYNIAKLLTEKDIIFKKTEYIQTMPQPQSGFHLELLDTTTIIDAFTQKHDSWEYEEEYKLIVRTDENTPVLKKCDIEEIYLGKDISLKDAEFIKNTVDNKNNTDGTDIKLYQMKINEHNIFELKRYPYL